jgi:hypothetical protein
MPERSIIAYEHYRDASQRFEYFILGLSSALCAYTGQTLTPQKLGISPYGLEVISLLLLVSSVFVGFKRIEKMIICHNLNHQVLNLSEQRGQLVTNFAGRTLVNRQTGDLLDPAQTVGRLADIEAEIPQRRKQLDEAAARANTYYKVRNWLLATGFLGLLVSKILIPYFH